MTSDDQTPGRTAVARRPQELVRALLGVVDADLGCSQPIPVRVYLEVLTELGVSEVACRATLSRMAKKGALERSLEGRSVAFRASPRTRDLLFRDRERILSSSPFEHPGDGWTVLMFSVPESRRDVRHRLRTRLSWAGFGPLGDGLWIAPGSPDVDDVLIVVQDPADPGSSITVFDAVPRLPTRAEDVVAQAWNLPAVRGEHDTFLQEWEAVEESELSALATLSALSVDWIRLLRVDPGLPARYLPHDWPAGRSTATYRRHYERLGPAARSQFTALG